MSPTDESRFINKKYDLKAEVRFMSFVSADVVSNKRETNSCGRTLPTNVQRNQPDCLRAEKQKVRDDPLLCTHHLG